MAENRSQVVLLLQPPVGIVRAGRRYDQRAVHPIDCCSSEFLFCLNSSIAGSAYRAWSRMGAGVPALLPPDSFHFDVLCLD